MSRDITPEHRHQVAELRRYLSPGSHVFQEMVGTLLFCFALSGALVSDQTSVKPQSRGHFAIAYDDAAGKVAMTGGAAFTAGQMILFDDYWNWDGKKWTRGTSTQLLLMGARMAYDPIFKRMVMFGGSGERPLPTGDLRALVGNAWVTLSGAAELKGVDPGFAIDTQRKRFVAFIPGPDGQDPRTFEWDGKIWRPGKGKGPAGHQGASMVYDEKRGVMVLFGGRGVDKQPTNDIWEYDGLRWLQVLSSGPAERSYCGIAYDAKLGAVVIHGGMDANFKWLGDTWSWDGKGWKQLSAKGPALELGMAYDKERDRLVVFGSESHENNASRMQVWEWDGVEWKQPG